MGSPNEDTKENGPTQDYVAQPFERNKNVKDALPRRLFGGTRDNPAAWPELGEPVSDYSTPNIQAGAFPTLFPHGVGDATNCGHPMPMPPSISCGLPFEERMCHTSTIILQNMSAAGCIVGT
jgi:hypothetical protein